MKTLKHLVLSCVAIFTVAAQAEQSIEVRAASDNAQILATDYLSYNFGNVWVNSLRVIRYDITNNGDMPLAFVRATISGIEYDAYHNCTAGLQVGEKCSFEIRFWPRTEGNKVGRFGISFSEDINLIVDLWGRGVRP